MLRVFDEGDDVFRLEDAAGARVGTIRNRAIAFHGFATERDAWDGAVPAWHAMNAALQRAYASWPRHELAADRLRTTHDGAYEWLYDGTRAIARLLRPVPGAHEGYGIELLLPSYASEGVAISAANGIALAVAPFRDAPAAVRMAARGTARSPDDFGAPLAG